MLVVEDDSEIAEALQRSMRLEGYEVRLAGDGAEGLEVARSFSPDLVVLDLGLPGVDGIEVARMAAARTPGLRIMFITGFAAVALSEGSRAPEGAKVLSKPVHLREIVSEVERMIAA